MTDLPDFDALVSKYRTRALLIDTNLFLLYLVGLFDEHFVGEFKRTRQYSREDFEIVKNVVARFRRVVTTPYVLAELSNLSVGIKGERRSRYFQVFTDTLKEAREERVEKDLLLVDPELPEFGLTDLSIKEAARGKMFLVLTDDLAAWRMLQADGCDALNFNHLRYLQWSA